jgi:CheY-like chemotaxis protein/HPt (histidine-containing phosphotransfer) domain-containing protein
MDDLGLAMAARPARVLLVEDVPVNQELARTVLEAAGHTVAVAGDGFAALEALGGALPDIVLMDVQMPGMDGLEATRRIRAMPGPAARLPIVAMTANVLPSEVARFMRSGMDAHVAKPFVPSALVATLDRLLGMADADDARPRDAVASAQVRYPETAGLIRLLGPAKAALGMAELARQCRESLLGSPLTAEGRGKLRDEAHALVSAAGMFGFPALSEASAELDRFVEGRVASEGVAAFAVALSAARERAASVADAAERIALGLGPPRGAAA